MKKIILWLKAMRASFFPTSFISVLVGAAVSSGEHPVSPAAFCLALLVVVSNQAGANLINDYFDAAGSDPLNQNSSPFNGGSRLIQRKILARQTYFKAAVLAFGIALLTSALAAVAYRNLLIFGLGLAGAAIGWTYSAVPFRGMSRGWGELTLGIGYGPLAVLGSYLLQTNQFAWKPVLAGVPVGFLIMGVLILNELPDVAADRAAGKRNLVVRAGGSRAGLWVYLTVITLVYLAISIGVFAGVFPPGILISYFSIPLAVWIVLKTWSCRSRIPELIPAMAGNVGLTILIGLLLSLGFWGH
ncbi:1,4-dihydroxy-2-naphthoate octaprenyltransferase [Hydrogenispora ethanolica]|jgi:1,4-dihydroxy-2-naphthoate octaprenyltransferase|uniref:1,4-dihydroxy-2-naphthoate octaprenyltransferase n=1 Tax=Hydrogenispora ethanolica TaxID=1082276 RepID=A0A4R1QN20_HYDET|nr:prenyltransferase [Hydrogenispora ethanolica]TCL55138.1 1,4-dihydroxy-2-naphthoate octaprenyltransferase [Hydrogenispora ethanolica]